jgi:polyisoprenoid-binding protein YceI
MKRVLLAALVTVSAAASAVVGAPEARSESPASKWTVDPVHSTVLFKIKHLGASWTYGRFDSVGGGIYAADDGSAPTAVRLVVKTDSVNTGNEKRDGHLKSPDFFSAKQFPEITFKSTSAKALDADTTEVAGDLTLHGVTKPVTAKVVRVGTGSMQGRTVAGWETTLSLKRSDFGMEKMVGPVGDDVTLTVAVEAGK